jgi:hypothetical protein
MQKRIIVWQSSPPLIRSRRVRRSRKEGHVHHPLNKGCVETVRSALGPHSREPEGSNRYGCSRKSRTPVPTAANDLMAGIHNCMPVILARRDEDLWLDRSMSDQMPVLACLQSYPSELMEADPVSELVNSVGNDRRERIEPIR